MFRIEMVNLTIHRITGSKNPLPSSSINLINTYNLKNQKFSSLGNDIESKYKADAIFPATVNASALIPRKKKPKYSSFGEIKSQNHVVKKFNTLSRTSNFLLNNHSFVTNSYGKTVGVRNLSNEPIRSLSSTELTGLWKDLSESPPVEFVQDHLISFQASTHLPWWATIILTTFVVRSTLTLPFSLYQHYIFAKVHNLQNEMGEIVKELKHKANLAVSRHSYTEAEARMMYNRLLKDKWDELIQKRNCHPAKGYIVIWTQIPLWITISAALRNLCYMLPPNNPNAGQVFAELTTGGFGWVTNLIDVDHFWILPICVGVFNLTNIEIMSLLKNTEDTKLQKYVLNFLRFFSVAMIPVATFVPSCISLYWASSSAFGVIQNLVLLSPKVRRLSGIPLTTIEKKNPYKELVHKFRTKKYINFNRKSKHSV